MSRVVLGVDPSRRKMALVISVDGLVVSMRARTLASGTHELPRACAEAFVFLRKVCKEYADHDVHVFIEDPIVAGHGGASSTIVQARVNGAAIAGAIMAGAEVQGVHISRWKKQVVGKGNASKTEVKDALRTTWPTMYARANGDQDLIDAGAILLYGQKVLGIADTMKNLT